jgi:hypothetical protein
MRIFSGKKIPARGKNGDRENVVYNVERPIL